MPVPLFLRVCLGITVVIGTCKGTTLFEYNIIFCLKEFKTREPSPGSSLSDIYSSVDGNHVLFNGDRIMLADFEKKPAEIDKAFFQKPYDMTERPADLAAYSYGELCFAIDYFYGRPGRKPAIDKDIETKGLDQMLGEEVRKLLKSTNMDEYVFGLVCLAAQLSDGGHTHISPISNSYVIGLADRSNLIEYVNKYVNAFKGQYPEEAELASSNIMADDGNEFCPHPVSASSTMQAKTSTEA